LQNVKGGFIFAILKKKVNNDVYFYSFLLLENAKTWRCDYNRYYEESEMEIDSKIEKKK